MSQASSRAQGVPTHSGRGWVHNHDQSAFEAWTPTTPESNWASGPGARSSFLPAAPRVTTGSRQALCLWLPTFELRLELMRSPELDSTSVALLAPGESTRR